jgi:hypothetical protein
MMQARSIIGTLATALLIGTSSVALSQAPGTGPGTSADHHPTDPKSSDKPSTPGTQAQGSPMGPGMMGPGMMMGPGQMGPGMMMRQGQMSPGMMMGGRGMMGPGMMMGHHAHHGMTGHHGMMMGLWSRGRGIYLSANDIRRIVDGQLAWRGLKRLKVGAVKVVNNDTVAADIVTREGSLAVRLHVDRRTGRAVMAD